MNSYSVEWSNKKKGGEEVRGEVRPLGSTHFLCMDGGRSSYCLLLLLELRSHHQCMKCLGPVINTSSSM